MHCEIKYRKLILNESHVIVMKDFLHLPLKKMSFLKNGDDCHYFLIIFFFLLFFVYNPIYFRSVDMNSREFRIEFRRNAEVACRNSFH